MKKFLLSMAVLAVGAMSVSAGEVLQYDLKFGPDYNQNSVQNYKTDWTVKCGTTVWNMSAFNNNQNKWDGFVRAGNKSYTTVASIVNAEAWSQEINQIVINAKKNSADENDKVTTAKVELLSSLTATTATATYDITDDVNSLGSTTSDIVVNITNPVANMYYRIVLDMPLNSNNGWFELHGVKYYVESSLQDPEISFPQLEYTAHLGQAFESPKATTVSDGAVTYTSSNEEVATVNAETGEITLVAVGTTTITATVAETSTYFSSYASYELTVIDPNAQNPVWSWNKSTTGSIEPFTSILVGDNTLDPWTYDNRFGLKGSAYKSGSANATEAIAASPVIDLSNHKDLVLNFRQAANQYKDNGTMIEVSEFPDYAVIVARVAGAEEWAEVAKAKAPASFSWDFYDNEEIDLSAYNNKKIQIGFKYISTATMAGTWEIDNIVVSGKVGTGVAQITVDENVAPVYYNMQGVRVANPEKGLYIEVRGNKSRKVIF